MERPPKRYFCNKCWYVGSSNTHPGCNYFAYPMAHLEQLYIDHLEAELTSLRASPASAPVSEDRKDAERYRVLKSGDFSVEKFVSSSYGWKFVPMEELDAAIDAAMQEDKP